MEKRRNVKILFIHGYLQSGDMFKELCKPLLDELNSEYDVDAIFPNAPTSLSKTRTDRLAWTTWDLSKETVAECFKKEEIEYLNFDKSFVDLKELLSSHPDIEFIVAYSQGALLALFIALVTAFKCEDFNHLLPSFRSFIFFSGFCKPYPLNDSLKEKFLEAKESKFQFKYPTLHIIGEKDTYIPKEMTLEFSEFFDESTRKIVYQKKDHAFPKLEDFDFSQVREFIKANL